MALPSRRDLLASGFGAAVVPASIRSAGAGTPPDGIETPHHARLRQPGPPRPAEAEPPRADRPEARNLFGESRLVTLHDKATWSEGPVWWASERTLVWSDVVGRRVLGWREDGAVDALIDPAPFINGNSVDPQGRLLHCEHGRRAISISDGAGMPRLLATQADGKRLNSPNDLVVADDGAIWFTDPTFGIDDPRQGWPAPSESGRMSVCRLAPGAAEATRMADMDGPNGLGFSPDGGTLYVSQTPQGGGESGVFAFDWDGARLSGRRRFAQVEVGVPDGFAVDRRGRLWCSSGAGVAVFDAAGARLALVPTPGLCSNCAFDADERRLFVTGEANLWMLALDA